MLFITMKYLYQIRFSSTSHSLKVNIYYDMFFLVFGAENKIHEFVLLLNNNKKMYIGITLATY